MGERGPQPEAERAHWELELAKRDEEIITALRPQDIEVLKDLYTENLTKKKSRIVGVRSEDLYAFLQAVQQGELRIEPVLDRGNIGQGMYLTVNPESETVRDRFSGATHYNKHFKESVLHNSRLYSYASVPRALQRNVLAHIDLDEMFRVYKDAGEVLSEEQRTRAALSIFNEAQTALLDRETSRWYERGEQAIEAIVAGASKRMPRDVILTYIKKLEEQKGIMVAFNDKVFKNTKCSLAQTDILTEKEADELIIVPKNGCIPLSAIEGFEVLGNYEERLLERIGVTESGD